MATAAPMVVEPDTEVPFSAADETGLMHYRARIASINAQGEVIDLRPPAFGDPVKNGGTLTGLTAPSGELVSHAGTRAAAIPANTDWAVPRYEVGSKKLQVFLAGVPCFPGDDPEKDQFREVGQPGSMSTAIQWHDEIPTDYDIHVRVK